MNTTTATTGTEDDIAQMIASGIMKAAQRTAKKFGDRKAFICSVLEEIGPVRFDIVGWMIKLNRKGLIGLSRADLVGAMDPEWVAESEVNYLTATFHFVALC